MSVSQDDIIILNTFHWVSCKYRLGGFPTDATKEMVAKLKQTIYFIVIHRKTT